MKLLSIVRHCDLDNSLFHKENLSLHISKFDYVSVRVKPIRFQQVADLLNHMRLHCLEIWNLGHHQSPLFEFFIIIFRNRFLEIHVNLRKLIFDVLKGRL